MATVNSESKGTNMTTDTLAEFLKAAAVEMEKYDTCMSLTVSQDGLSVELCLDTSVHTYGEWIEGEGGDICLLRCMDTNKVMGCHLPLMDRKLSVFHDGPLKINEGF